MKESDLVRRIVTELQDRWPLSWWMKVHGSPYQPAGTGDIIGCIRGRFVSLEVKVPGKEDTLTKRQRHHLELIRRAQGHSAMVTSVEEALRVAAEAADRG